MRVKFYKDEIIYSILYNINGYLYVCMKNMSINIGSDKSRFDCVFYEYIKLFLLHTVEFIIIFEITLRKSKAFLSGPKNVFVKSPMNRRAIHSIRKSENISIFFVTPCMALSPFGIGFRQIIYVVQRDKMRHVTQR